MTTFSSASMAAETFAQKYIKVFLGILVIGLLGLGGYKLLNYMKVKDEHKAFAALYPIEKKYYDQKRAFYEAENKKSEPKENAKDLKLPAPKAIKTGDLDKDYGTIAKELDGFIRANLATKAAAYAGFLLADLAEEYKRQDQFSPTLTELAKSQPESSLTRGLMGMLQANQLAQNKKCDKAVEFWSEVLKNDEASFLHAEAALRSGVCYEALGNQPKAVEAYARAKDLSTAQGAIGTTAGQFLRAAETLTHKVVQKVDEVVSDTAASAEKKSEKIKGSLKEEKP